MADDAIIGTDHPLSAAQRRCLALVLDRIIPASDDGRKPSAAEVDVLGYIRDRESHTLAALGEELQRLDAEAAVRHGAPFAALDAETRHRLMDDLRSSEPNFLHTLALQAAACYYQDDRVLEALGLEPRPPYPKGYEVPAGDLSLLDPVRRRGRIYRDA